MYRLLLKKYRPLWLSSGNSSNHFSDSSAGISPRVATKLRISSASPLLYASSSQNRLRIGKTEAPSTRNPTLFRRGANDLGKLGCAQWARHDFMTRDIRSGD